MKRLIAFSLSSSEGTVRLSTARRDSTMVKQTYFFSVEVPKVLALPSAGESLTACSRELMQYHPRIVRRCDLVTFVAVAGRAAGVE